MFNANQDQVRRPIRRPGFLRVLQQDNDLNWDVRIEIMRSGLNENGWDYRNIGRYANTFRGTPSCAPIFLADVSETATT